MLFETGRDDQGSEAVVVLAVVGGREGRKQTGGQPRRLAAHHQPRAGVRLHTRSPSVDPDRQHAVLRKVAGVEAQHVKAGEIVANPPGDETGFDAAQEGLAAGFGGEGY